MASKGKKKKRDQEQRKLEKKGINSEKTDANKQGQTFTNTYIHVHKY